MNKLEKLNKNISLLRNNKVQNLLKKLISYGDFEKALFFTAGCLTYCDDEDVTVLNDIRDTLL